MTTRRARSLAYGVAAVSLLLTTTALLLVIAITTTDGRLTIDANGTGGFVLGLTFPIVGAIVASRRPRNPIGWIYLIIGLSQALDTFASRYSEFGLVTSPGSLPLADFMSWVAIWAWAPGLVLFGTISLLLFPDGRHPSPPWRVVSGAAAVATALIMLPAAIATWPMRGALLVSQEPNPGAPGPIGVAFTLQAVGLLLLGLAAVGSLLSLVVRWRKARGTERAQLKWLAFAVMIELPVVIASTDPALDPALAAIVALFSAPLIPIAIGIAILRYRLFEIDRIISRTLGYAVVTITLAIVFVGAVLGLTAVLEPWTGGNTIAVAASTLVVAALFQPLRQRIQRVVDRRFDRARYDGQRLIDSFVLELRDEVDLTRLQVALLATADDAVRPASARIWLALKSEP
jgi:hypothetical protein